MASLSVMDGNLDERTWINISDSRSELCLGNRVSFPTNLYLKKRVNSPYFYSSWMPDLAEDYRVVTKKRRPLESSTGTADARQASLNAITWMKEKQKDCVYKTNEIVETKSKCLEYYWEEHFEKYAATRGKNDSGKQQIRDERNKWFSPTYGIGKEQFSKIRVDQISRKDINDYFHTLSQGMKSQQKTVLKSLFTIAEPDFIGHSFPSFPKIDGVQKEQVKHFEYDEFESLLKTIIELSGGVANKEMSFEEYSHLEYNKFNRQNQRNWVDLYDAIWVNYFFFLRSQDVPRLQIKWFTENPEHEEFVIRNNEPKGDRKIEDTRNLKPDAYPFFKRLLKRRPDEGWLNSPFIKRPIDGGAEKYVIRTLNFLLKKAAEKCLSKWDKDDVNLTTIRHTTFRHHIEDDMALSTYPKIKLFAENGLTSPDMLQKTYINYISRERTLRESKKNMRSSNYSLIK